MTDWRSEDSKRCYDLGEDIKREIKVRAHDYGPRNEAEARWWSEGPRPFAELETVRRS